MSRAPALPRAPPLSPLARGRARGSAHRLPGASVKEMKKPYFGDMSNLKYEKGKTFTAPPRLFKAEAALFFPNLQGVPLLESHWARCDTTPLLTGKISVVVFQSCLWAERQVATFISREANPALHEVLYRNDDVAQVVHINYEVNFIKAIITRLFRRSLRKSFPEGLGQVHLRARGRHRRDARVCRPHQLKGRLHLPR